MAAQAQTTATWDTSGNGMLSGTYYFRQVFYVLEDEYGDLGEAVSIYGNITFNGNGTYSLTQGQWLVYDSGSGAPETANLTGTYSISASGYGFVSNPYTGDSIYGLVSQQGIFVGSSTENSSEYNDLFVAAPLASPVPTAASFSGTYVFSNLDLVGADEGQTPGMLSMMFTLTANGACGLGSTTVTGYAGTSPTPYTQISTLPTCLFSNGAAVVTFPTNGELMQGQKYLYFSKDGNFVFGGSPYTGYNPWDMIVGVKVSSGTPSFSGLYYQAGIDDVDGDLDTYYGSLDSVAGGKILAHQRVDDLFFTPTTTDTTYLDSYTLTSGATYSTSFARYAVGAGGAIRIGSGIGPYLGLSVALQAPTVAPTISGTGVFLNPQGIVNAGSWAPFTAGIAPGELLTLFNGTNLAPAGTFAVAASPFQATLAQVQVSIGGLPAPIYYVTPTQIAAIVPYEVTPGTIVDIQVTNNGVLSNAVPVFVNETQPGVLTANENGLGYADAERPDYSIVSAANPTVPGETISVYLTGLGAVSPSITDGGLGTFSQVPTGTVTAEIGGMSATVTYAGLAPGYSGLYQLNVTIPTGLTAGDNYLEIDGTDASNVQSLIPISTTGSIAADPTAAAVPAPGNHPLGRPKVNPKAKRPPSLRSAAGK